MKTYTFTVTCRVAIEAAGENAYAAFLRAQCELPSDAEVHASELEWIDAAPATLQEKDLYRSDPLSL